MDILKRWQVVAVVCIIALCGGAFGAEEKKTECKKQEETKAEISKVTHSSSAPAPRATSSAARPAPTIRTTSSSSSSARAKALADARARAVAASRASRTTRVVATEVVVDPFKDSSVLVEAFMVRVSTAALIESGASPISNGSEGVSITNILRCLRDKKKAEVRSGVKAMANHRGESRVSNSKSVYRKSISSNNGRELIKYKSYAFGSEIEIHPTISSTGVLKIHVQYENTDIVENEDPKALPGTNNFVWEGIITAKSGVPVIAAAVQSDAENMTFLILTATIQGEKKCKKK